MCTKITTRIAAFALCVCLVLSMCVPLLPGNTARADDLSDAKAALSAAESQLATVANEYNDIQKRIAEVESNIEATTTKAEEAQTEMLEGQKELGKVLVSSYKNEATSSLVNVFLASDSMESFIRNVTYYSALEQQKAEQIAEQKKRSEQFSSVLDELDQQKAEQEQLAAQAQEKKDQAEQIVAAASSKVSSIESERARVEALKQQASSMQGQQQQQRPPASISQNWNTTTSQGSNSGSSNSGGDVSAPSGSGWHTGIASAYGGSSDKNTPNPGTTATGAICNDTSMGVAVPMAWSNYRSYLGRKVEIKYNGRTVIATVNDCGGMGGGSRSLDLQPGVFKAFGFSTCQEWGLRTVSYRFL